jgi:hypothetical protein
MRRKTAPSPFWQSLIDHINDTWKLKKGFGYPFTGRDMRDLKGMERIFGIHGTMALWDVYIAIDAPFVKKGGWNIGFFCRSIPWLTDDKGWKFEALKYEEKLKTTLVEPDHEGIELLLGTVKTAQDI